MDCVIDVKNLVRDYAVKSTGSKKTVNAVKGISFQVFKGEVFGILGPNGAGKTTTMKVLTTMLTPSSGHVSVLGMDVLKDAEHIRRHINFVFGGERGVYPRLTAREYLDYFACLYRLPASTRKEKVHSLLRLVGLENKSDDKIYTYSKGMKQRLLIARSLLNDPELLFLDEPTIGLDPVIADELRNLIRNLSGAGITIVLSTHYMQEADDLCGRVAIINNGQIRALGSPDDIKREFSDCAIYEVLCRKKTGFNSDFSEKVRSASVVGEFEDGYMLLRLETDSSVGLHELGGLLSNQIDIINASLRGISLEDAYIKLVKVG